MAILRESRKAEGDGGGGVASRLKERKAVTLGAHDRCESHEKGRLEVPVEEITVHPEWDEDEGDFLNDIAVLRLARPVEGFAPVALPPAAASGPQAAEAEPEGAGSEALLVGFGKTSSDAKKAPCFMNAVRVPVLSRAECKRTSLPDFYTEQASQFCAGREEGGADACQGDSGGPLLLGEKDNFVLIGIVSFGFGCGDPNSPGVYTRVASFVPWLQKHIGNVTQ